MGGQWARLKTTADAPLRRGAWYQVAAITGVEVTVTVEGKPVALPRSFVQLRASPPREWTVLRPEIVPARTQEMLRNGYMVCPSCRARVVLPPAQVREQLCPRCGGTFLIAWNEKYLGGR